MKRNLAAILLFTVLAAAIAWSALIPPRAVPTESLTTIGGNTMGGTWSVKLRQAAPKLQPQIQSLLDQLEFQMSTYRPDSDLSRFNQSQSTDWIDVPQDLAQVIAQAQRVSEQTNGAFDITIAPLVNLWGFGPTSTGLRQGQIPTDAEIAAAQSHVDFHRLHVRVTPPALKKDDPDLAIDLSAIAKGYAADRIAEYLEAQGIPNYLVAIGGELRAKGQPHPNQPWRVGIELPTPDTHRILHSIELQNEALSTSGDYRNFYTLNGQRFSHEINPKIGRPIQSNLASVSIIHLNSAYADALATAMMILGPEEGQRLANELHLKVQWITREKDHFETRATADFNTTKNTPQRHGDTERKI